MRTEKALTALFLVGMLFKYFDWEGQAIIPFIALMALSVLYLLGGFYFFCDQTLRRQHLAFSIIAGVGLSAAPIGILFRVLHWEGMQVMILTAMLTSILLLITTIILRLLIGDRLKTYYNNMLWRTGIFTTVSTVLFVTT